MNFAATYLRPDPGTFHPAVGGAILASTFAGNPATIPGQGSTPYPSFGTTQNATQRGPSPMEGQTFNTPGIPSLLPITWQPPPPRPTGVPQNWLPMPPVGLTNVGGAAPGGTTAPAPSGGTSGGLPIGWLAAGAAVLALLYLGSEDKKKTKGRRGRA